MRYMAEIKSVCDSGKVKYVYQPDEDKCDLLKLTKVLELVNIRDYNTGNIVLNNALVFFTKELERNSTKLFNGNTIAFDATINGNKVQRIRNICSKVEYYCGHTDVYGNLLPNAKQIDSSLHSICTWCKHYDNIKDSKKASCKLNCLQ